MCTLAKRPRGRAQQSTGITSLGLDTDNLQRVSSVRLDKDQNSLFDKLLQRQAPAGSDGGAKQKM